jgi:hypothetical protein
VAANTWDHSPEASSFTSRHGPTTPYAWGGAALLAAAAARAALVELGRAME